MAANARGAEASSTSNGDTARHADEAENNVVVDLSSIRESESTGASQVEPVRANATKVGSGFDGSTTSAADPHVATTGTTAPETTEPDVLVDLREGPQPKQPTGLRGLLGGGTSWILAGSLVAGLAAYIYQFLGGRVLGAEAFAPVSVLLTIHFLVFTVVLLPIEQMIVRRLTLDRDATEIPRRVWGLVAAALVVSVSYAWIGVDTLLRGDLRFVGFVAATVLTHTLFVIGRGRLAGWRRFRAYGTASGTASLLRLGVAVAVLAVRPTASGFALGLILGPLVVMAWRPRHPIAVDHKIVAAEDAATMSDKGLLSGLVLSSAVSQSLLLAGPLLVAALGGGEALVSIAFATFTVLRAPLVFGYNMLARVLPPMTEMAARGERRELWAWGRAIGIAAAVLAAMGAVVGGIFGPNLVTMAFGSEFGPTTSVAAMIAGGVVLAGAGLFVGQVLVARSEPFRLAAAWMAGMAAAAIALGAGGGDPLQRVALAFVIGETVALAALVAGTVAGVDTNLRGYRLAKRSIDIVGSMILIVLALPILIISAVLVKLGSPGPALFRQERVSRNAELFTMVKLRTMRADGGEDVFIEHLRGLEAARSQAQVNVLKIEDDPRVTPIGRHLRAASLDELPNLLNVFLGSMSLVGPRPLVPAEAELIGYEHSRFDVKPGVTGLAQVMGRDEISISARSELDAQYVSNRSIGGDVKILGKTVVEVLRRIIG